MTAKGLSISLHFVFAPALLVCGLNVRVEPSEVRLTGQPVHFQDRNQRFYRYVKQIPGHSTTTVIAEIEGRNKGIALKEIRGRPD